MICFIFWPVLLLATKLKFVKLLSESQSIKSYHQISDFYNEVESYYISDGRNRIEASADYNIFMYLDNDKLAAFVAISLQPCYFQSKIRKVPYLGIFLVTVTENYRNKGLTSNLLLESIEFLKNKYSLSDETILALHLSPNDKKMPQAGTIYYQLGFKQGMFSNQTPTYFKKNIEELLNNSIPLFEAVNYSNSQDGHYFVAYCLLKDFKKNKEFPYSTIIEHTERLYQILNIRQAKSKKL